MNEFLQQFVIESRELADTAGDGLLALEQSPGDRERLDEVFRAFHTLKGSAAIVEFPAMESSMHAAEEVLAAARAGSSALTAANIGQCLAHLDQVSGWLDIIEQSGELPPDPTGAHAASAASPAQRAAVVWVGEIVGRHRLAAAHSLTAIRFVPGADSLYQGEDPLERMTSLPGLVALELSAREPWGAAGDLDPFRCNLILTALSSASAAELHAHLQGHTGDCGIVPITGAVEDSAGALPPHVAGVIEAQHAFLEETSARNFAGRVGSAAAVAANALRFCGRLELSGRISRAAGQSLMALSVQPLREALAQLLSAETPEEVAATVAAAHAPELLARTLRIDAEQVDALVRLAGELTVVNNAIGHVAKLARAGDPGAADLLKDRHGALEHLVAELRRSVLRMRVRPLRAVLQRFPRLVREMSANLGKSVKLVIEGDETEADKTIVEMLFEPLLHLVRNAIDHGVERAGERAAAGKAPTARLRIKAERVAGQVLIEISDDGAGIDLVRVRQIAATRGLVTEQQVVTLTEAETLNLIFAPGFTTATTVTEISGRGVGMDAVRRTVERVGGHVSLASVAGQGTSVKLSLPFSVMMTHVMTVEAGGQMFGLPLDAIIETIRIPQAAISKVGAAPVVVLRNRTVPVLDLASILRSELQASDDDDEATLVVAAANGECGAFRVDRIVERLDLILKPLEGLLAGTPGIMGTTLLGDGQVLLVLDIAEMLQ